MKLSKKFLNDYVDVNDISFHEVADKMLSVGNEYESISKLSSATNVVVGKIIECVKHPESDHLHICKVDIGSEVLQIVCGAPNARVGIKVCVALVGAVLPGDFKISMRKTLGVESNGMLCSLAELGIESKYLSEYEKEGIHELNDDAELGSDCIKLMGFDDEVIDFELTANKGDLLSVLGMAYEVGTIYDKEVKLPINEVVMTGSSIEDEYKLDVQTDLCSIYLGALAENVEIKESPEFIKLRLMASGIRPINNVVDISNYVMLEYGQPLHFFDASKLGKHVIVRNAYDNEKIVTLDNVSRNLNTSDIVIANEDGPVALAGVMGGLDTEVTEKTNSIFIESAIFDSVSIRKTSNNILRSEASNRFEKGIDPNRTIEALKRACYLLNKYAGSSTRNGILKHDKANHNEAVIDITLDKINSVLGMKLTSGEVVDILNRLKFKAEGEFHVTVPTRRMDVKIEEELIEEIGRMYGYDNLVGTLPIGLYKEGTYSKKTLLVKEIRKTLESFGLQQVNTYSLISDEMSDMFINEPYNKVCILSPIAENHRVMRNSLIPSLLEVYNYNAMRNIKDVKIYEAATKNREENGSYIEEKVVSGLLSGNYLVNGHNKQLIKCDFYLLKGIIEELLNKLGFNNRYTFEIGELNDMHPGKSAVIKLDKNVIGYLGQIHPNISKTEIYVFEISVESLYQNTKKLRFKEISKYPSIVKDVAFIVPKKITSDLIVNEIKRTCPKLLTNVEVFDVYTGTNILDSEKSIAYSLTFADSTRTLNDEEVTDVFKKIIENVENKFNAKLRDK